MVTMQIYPTAYYIIVCNNGLIQSLSKQFLVTDVARVGIY